jgi:hypothetical protein
MNAFERAIAIVSRAKQIRSDALAAELGLAACVVEAMLEPARADGRLVACSVVLEGVSLVEYRISTSGGHTHLYGRTDRRLKPTPYWNPRPESEPLPAPASPASAPEHAEDQREIATVGIAEKIKAAFEQHGPMTSRQLAAHVEHDKLSELCWRLWKSEELRQLGGARGSFIYGLPTQTLADRKEPDEAAPETRRGTEEGEEARRKDHAQGRLKGR